MAEGPSTVGGPSTFAVCRNFCAALRCRADGTRWTQMRKPPPVTATAFVAGYGNGAGGVVCGGYSSEAEALAALRAVTAWRAAISRELRVAHLARALARSYRAPTPRRCRGRRTTSRRCRSPGRPADLDPPVPGHRTR